MLREPSLCCPVILFLPILSCTRCLTTNPPRCIQGCHFQSCSIAFYFLSKYARAQAALLVDDKECEAFLMTATNCFCGRSSEFLPTGLEEEHHAAIQYPNTRCSWQATCAFRTCLRKNTFKSDNIVEHEG